LDIGIRGRDDQGSAVYDLLLVRQNIHVPWLGHVNSRMGVQPNPWYQCLFDVCSLLEMFQLDVR
jgi:hypothetical protein